MYINSRTARTSLSLGRLSQGVIQPVLHENMRGRLAEHYGHENSFTVSHLLGFYDFLYNRLRDGGYVRPTDVTREFAAWLFEQYGLADPVFEKATAMLVQLSSPTVPEVIQPVLHENMRGRLAEHYGHENSFTVSHLLGFYDFLYNRLRDGGYVRPTDVTQEFVDWLFKQYGPGDPVFEKATAMLEQQPPPAIEDVAAATYIPAPQPANGFAPTEAMPTFIDTALAQTSPWLKYGLLALGAFIFYDSFVRSQPRKRTVRRRSPRRRRISRR